MNVDLAGVRKIITQLRRENVKLRQALETIMEGEVHPEVLAFLTLKEVDEDASNDG